MTESNREYWLLLPQTWGFSYFPFFEVKMPIKDKMIYYFTLQKYFVNYKQRKCPVRLFSNVPNSLLPATYEVSLSIALLYKFVAAGLA